MRNAAIRWQQTLTVPNAGNPFQLIEFITAMIKANGADFCELVGIIQLLGLQLVVIFPIAQKLSSTGRDAILTREPLACSSR